MSAALPLVGYAVVLAVLGPALLGRARWVDRAPRLGIWTWLSLTAAVLAAATLAGLAVVVPVSAFSTDVAEFLRMCVMMLQAAYATPGGALSVTAALLATTLILGRAGYGVAVELATARRERRRHLAVLEMVARQDARLGALVVDHGAATAYCLPGRGGRIVLTTQALATLDAPRLAAVLAHERAHLRERHHLLVAIAQGLRRAFPMIGLFAAAAEEVGRLTELAADDDAVRAADRLTVADALLTLAEGQRVPAMALAASGRHTGQRVRRLLSRTPPLRLAVTLPIGLLALVALATPALIAAAPAFAAAVRDCCTSL